MPINQNATFSLKDGHDFTCPDGGQFYVCPMAWTQFMGCCARDPCRFGYGECPESSLRATFFDRQDTDKLVTQDCVSNPNSRFGLMTFTNCAEEGSNVTHPFFGCCFGTDTCTEEEEEFGCAQDKLTSAILSMDSSRQILLAPDEPPAMIEHREWRAESDTAGLLGFGEVLGLVLAAIAVLLAAVALLAWKMSWLPHSRHKTPLEKAQRHLDSLQPRGSSVQSQTTLHARSEGMPQLDWNPEPQTLRTTGAALVFPWIWDALLTISPSFFIVLAILAIRLDGEAPGPHGQMISEIVRLSPSLYPIVFATVASRFFKGVTRWRLEQRDGIKLGIMEQIFGSQSFGGSLEKLLFLRAHITAGIFLFLIWTMSPVGGQSASRILFIGDGQLASTGSVFFADPAYQFSHFYVGALARASDRNVGSLYNLALMSSSERRRALRDSFDLPRIPQWPRDMGNGTGEYQVDEQRYLRGEEDYTSLLGVKIQGLDLGGQSTRYELSVQTSYIDLQCLPIGPDDFTGDPEFGSLEEDMAFRGGVDVLPMKKNPSLSFAAEIRTRGFWNFGNRSIAETVPDFHLLFAGLQPNETSEDGGDRGNSTGDVFGFNCTMITIQLETEIHCPSPTNCTAVRQRRMDRAGERQFPSMMQKHMGGLVEGVKLWPHIAAAADNSSASPTENLLAGEAFLYGTQPRHDWSRMDEKVFSRRLTTAFNTFWDAAKGPLGYPNLDMASGQAQRADLVSHALDVYDFYNTTQATGRPTGVYRADRIWIGILLACTVMLQVLAILGVVLLAFIRGPDIMGFASSVTRDNPYIPIPSAGSSLGGADRARDLGEMRVQLADVSSESDVGYIAVRTVPAAEKTADDYYEPREQSLWRPIDRDRLYR